MANKEILAITLGGSEIPSANFRLRQYYPYLKHSGFVLKEISTKQILYPKFKLPGVELFLKKSGLRSSVINFNLTLFHAAVKNSDIIWVNKILKPDLLKIIKAANKKIVFDIDDAIWLDNEDYFIENMKVASAVIAGNKYIEENVRHFFSGIIYNVPTTIDLVKYPTMRMGCERKKFIVGWLGSEFTNSYLKDIHKPLNQFLSQTNSVLHIISKNFTNFKDIFPKNTVFKEWNADSYINDIAQFNVGLMPMPDEEWVKGKCSFKMLQYMGAFVPAIVSPYGMNAEVLKNSQVGLGAKNQEEWIQALLTYYNDDSLRLDHAHKGRAYIENKYCTTRIFEDIQSIFINL